MGLTMIAATTLHDVGFGLLVGGAGATWIGGVNVAARRLASRRWGQLGGSRAVWFRYGFFLMPDWVSVPILSCGVVALVAGVLVSAIS